MSSLAILAPSSVPYEIGGAEKFWWGLHHAFSDYSSFRTELIKIPSPTDTFDNIIRSYKNFSSLDLSHFDVVVTSKFPAWMIRHPTHIVYLQHTLRDLYDTFHRLNLHETLVEYPKSLHPLMTLLRKKSPTRDDLALSFDLLNKARTRKSYPFSLFAFPGTLIREVVHFFDRVALNPSEIAAYAAISSNVAHRTDYFPKGVDIQILHHPSDITHFLQGEPQYIFTASRLTAIKRLDVIIKAMRFVPGTVRLKIAGTGEEYENLKELASRDPRIELLGFVSDRDLPSLYANALCVPFIPYDEDYGLITIEAMRSGKPVITSHDAGGVCEFVEDGVTGFVTDPTPEAVGNAMAALLASPNKAKTMGENAKKRVSQITWKNTVKTLIDHTAKKCLTRIPIPKDRPRVLVLSPFPFFPDSSRTGRRLQHLCKALSKNAFVLLISVSITASDIPKAEECLPNFWSLTLRPATGETRTLSSAISFSEVPHIREILSSYTDIACVLITSSSLYPFLNAALPNVPLLYDAKDIFSSKASLREETILSDRNISRHSMDMENACCKNAALILTSSNEEREEIEKLFSPDKQAVLVLPDGCDTAAFSVLTRTEKKALRSRLPYTGAKIALFEGENTECDLDAARFIFDLASELNAVDILMAGSVSDGIRDLHIQIPNNVHLLGKIPDGERHLLLAGTDIGLFPVRSFTKRGSNLHDAILAGLEGVALEPALRGLPKESLLCIRKARESDFADTVINALSAPSSDSDRQKAAKALASQRSWKKTLAPLETLLSQKALFPPKESRVPCTPAPCYKTSEQGLRIFLKSLYAASPLPKLLVCCSLSVRYPMSGGERRLFHVSEALSRHGNVVLIVYGDEEQREVIVQNLAPRLWQIRLPWRSDALASSREIFSRTREPSQDVSLLMHSADDPLLHSLLASQNDAALVLVSHPYLFPAVAGAIPNLPLIYDAHNVEADMKQVIFTNTEPEILSKVLETEKKCCERALAVLACSEENKKRFHTLYDTNPAKIHIVPNGCDTDTHTFTPPEKRRLLRQKLPYPDTKLALFLGSYHKPNIEAVRLIIDLAGRLPDLHVLVGGGVAPAFRGCSALPKNVHILGLLTEETKNLLLASVDLALNPMLSGSGTNLKMLEYIAAGLETVSTPFGMRGIPLDLSESVHTVAINDFANTVARILKAPASEAACRKAAMKVADLYSWRSTMRPLESLLRHYLEEDPSLTAEEPPI